MIKKISKTEGIKAKLRKEGKLSYLDKKKHVDAIIAMNDQLEIIRTEFQVKDRNSQQTASNVILTS